MPTRRITVAFSGRGPVIYVRDRRGTAICPRKRDGPCDIHPYHVQVRFFLSDSSNRSSSAALPVADSQNTYSIAFLLYAHIVFLVTLYATSGRNASDASPMKDTSSGEIELTAAPTAPRGGWYSRVRSEEPMHVIGNEEDEED